MKTIAKVFLILSLLAILLGGFDIIATNTATALTGSSNSVIQAGIVASVSADTGPCEDGRPGCKTSGGTG